MPGAQYGKVQLDPNNKGRARLNVFKSTEQTGTGSSQNVAHGLGYTPSVVIIFPTGADGNAFTITEGTHTSTNVVLTATSGHKFKVVAW